MLITPSTHKRIRYLQTEKMFIQEWVLAPTATILNLPHKLGTSNLYTSSPLSILPSGRGDPMPEDQALDKEPPRA